MVLLNMAEAINLGLHDAMSSDKDVVVLGQDVAVNGGVFRVTQGLLDKFGSARVIDTPLAESAIIGCTIGMALAGLKPIAEMQFSDFMYLGIHQLIHHASKIRNRSRGRFNVPIVIRAPIGGGIKALEHHSESMESIYLHVPGLKVVMPSTPYDAKGLLLSAINDPDPVIFFEPKKLYRLARQDIPTNNYTIEIGSANIVRQGKDVTLISWGNMVREALAVASSIEGISIEVIDLRSLQPWDIDTVSKSVKKTRRAVVVQEAPRNCSLASEISSALTERLMLELEAPILRVTGFDVPYPYSAHENYYLPNFDRISNAVKEVIDF